MPIAAGLWGGRGREGLGCSHSRAKCHKGEESRRDRWILPGDTRQAGKMRMLSSLEALTPLAWREPRPSLPRLCQGTPRFAAREKLPAGAPEPGMQPGARPNPPRGVPLADTQTSVPLSRRTSFLPSSSRLPLPSLFPPSLPNSRRPRRPRHGGPARTAQARGERAAPMRGRPHERPSSSVRGDPRKCP